MAKKRAKDKTRWRILVQIDDFISPILNYLSFFWLLLIVVEFTKGLSPFWINVNYVIWALFLFQFLLEFFIAPVKKIYIKHNWITGISVILPAFRFLRTLRFLRFLRSLRALNSIRLLRTLTSINRAMRAIGSTLSRRGFGYVLLLTFIVIMIGASGMYYFERPESLTASGIEIPENHINSFGDAFWWTAMQITTINMEYSPKTVEGRTLGWFISVYAMTVFGYITATIASHFIGIDLKE